ncbi:S41 family peptidase [Chryseobacterium balustinum]|uniref:C-terminal processing peptidase n=1 Tax=Chryseobacterium balustinum TaxID=246 RepID=A0AAX2IHM0_9FLAO|nr:S41 family peptidase [Chryseobacterium balustinum]AZB28781.1 peptidase S41 [Chryseobacterium balustinum]SKB86147.1 Peptidase family S41 [Chryseobacterium balustinum]SQA87641.1 C-terminal processing peptidase [Chryseobacterium balustinum]
MKNIKATFAFFLFTLLSISTYAQDCNCTKNFEWVKKTFEENDAGFQYAIKQKGDQAYSDLNKRISEKVKSAKTFGDCSPILYEWLTFFRSGHVSIRPISKQQSSQSVANNKSDNQFANWETLPVDTQDFKKYLDKKKTSDYEGIWDTEPYTIGIKKKGDQYIGFIIESGAETWTKGQVKLKLDFSNGKTSSVYYMRDHSAVESKEIAITGKNNLQIGDFSLSRIYPKIEDEPKYAKYFKSLNTNEPYIEKLNETTLYFRIPSFQASKKQKIDSVILANKNKILSTENLIIDIRNGTGGSDGSYNNILPLIYTNPIRTVGVEYLSTKLNNQRMLDFINKPEYGFNEENKKWAKNSFDKLEKEQGKFVNLNENVVTITKYDTIHQYPKNVGIIINQKNGSTDEQFLLAAKQSRKVKLFGTTTFGVLDVSNMYYVPSPCNEFELGYSLSRSMRIPDFTIDGKGLQPDFYLDRSIPLYEWTEYVNKTLNGQ